MTDDLVMCSCGLAKYAFTNAEGEWLFVCEACDGTAPLHPTPDDEDPLDSGEKDSG